MAAAEVDKGKGLSTVGDAPPTASTPFDWAEVGELIGLTLATFLFIVISAIFWCFMFHCFLGCTPCGRKILQALIDRQERERKLQQPIKDKPEGGREKRRTRKELPEGRRGMSRARRELLEGRRKLRQAGRDWPESGRRMRRPRNTGSPEVIATPTSTPPPPPFFIAVELGETPPPPYQMALLFQPPTSIYQDCQTSSSPVAHALTNQEKY